MSEVSREVSVPERVLRELLGDAMVSGFITPGIVRVISHL